MATPRRYQSLGPLLSGEGSRAFLGLSVGTEGEDPPYPVVLVWIPKDIQKDKARLDSVLRETRHAMQLDHPNIFKVLGLSTQSQGLARVVEYANAESLRRVIEARGKIPPEIAAKLVSDAAMGVHYAHVAGNDDGTPLVHGDLRPQTLFLTYTGVCKVSGYGGLAAAPREVGGRRVPGRRHHCAPEQVLGGRNAINVQTDIYLLGLVLLECLTGKVPFEDEKSEVDFDQAVLNKPLGDMPEVPEALREVIRRAMAKKASDRYASAFDFKEAVERAAYPTQSWQAVSDFINGLFPETHPTRDARKKLIEKGLAQAAGFTSLPVDPSLTGPQALGDLAASAPRPIAVEAITLASKAKLVVPKSGRSAMRPVPSMVGALAKPKAPAPPPPGPLAKIGPVVVVVATILVGAWGLWTMAFGPPTDELPRPTGMIPGDFSTDGGTSTAIVTPPEPVFVPVAEDAGEPVEEVVDAGPPRGPYNPDSGIPALHVFVEPGRVGVTIDGQYVGRSPVLYWPATPGRHVVSLSDRGQLVNVTKAVQVDGTGVTRAEIYLAKGYINVVAPDAATIYVDGKEMGRGAMRDIGVYEGNHHIVVTVFKSRWEQTFEIAAQQHLTFNVDFQ